MEPGVGGAGCRHWPSIRLSHSSAAFVDSATVRITAGRGGDGCVAFAREKYIPYGPPSGGNGGDGGHVYIRAAPGLRSLARVPSRVRAPDGLHGKGQWQNGRKAGDRVLNVPVGTVVSLLQRRIGQRPGETDDGYRVSADVFEPWQVRERAQALREEYEDELRRRARVYGEELPPDIAAKFEHLGDVSNRPQKSKKPTRRQRASTTQAEDQDADADIDSEEPYDAAELQRQAAIARSLTEAALLREQRDTVWKQYPRGAIDALGETDENETDAMYRLHQLAHAEQRLGLALLRTPTTHASHSSRLPEGAVPAKQTPSVEASARGPPEPIVWTADLSTPTPPESPGLLVAHGGAGGLGNPFFLTTVNRSPKYATKGAPGDDLFVHLELKTSADVGFVGFPNAGKSSLLQALTGAQGMGAEVGSWQFTTTSPNVGVMRVTSEGDLIGTGKGVISDTKEAETVLVSLPDSGAGPASTKSAPLQDESFRLVLADIPGLLPGAGTHNIGLGHSFLRHIERCSSLIFVIDISPERPTPWEDLRNLRAELEAYLPGLSMRGALVVANKADLLGRPLRGETRAESTLEGNGSDAANKEAEARDKLRRLRDEVRQLYEEDVARLRNRDAPDGDGLEPTLMPVIPVSAKWRLNVDEVARRLKTRLRRDQPSHSSTKSVIGRRSFSSAAAQPRSRASGIDEIRAASLRETSTKPEPTHVATDEEGIPLQPTWSVTELLAGSSTRTAEDLLSDTTLDKLHQLSALRPPCSEATRAHVRAALEPMVRLAESVRSYEIDPSHYALWTGDEEDARTARVVDARVAPKSSQLLDDEIEDEIPPLRDGQYDGTEEMPSEMLLGVASRRAGHHLIVDRTAQTPRE